MCAALLVVGVLALTVHRANVAAMERSTALARTIGYCVRHMPDAPLVECQAALVPMDGYLDCHRQEPIVEVLYDACLDRKRQGF